MAKQLMIQEMDHRRLMNLKKKLRAKSKVQIVRDALDALEERVRREQRIKHWRHATRLAIASSREINGVFQSHSRLKKRA